MDFLVRTHYYVSDADSRVRGMIPLKGVTNAAEENRPSALRHYRKML